MCDNLTKKLSLSPFIMELEPKKRDIFILRYQDKMTYEAIGKMFSLSKERVRQLLNVLNEAFIFYYIDFFSNEITVYDFSTIDLRCSDLSDSDLNMMLNFLKINKFSFISKTVSDDILDFFILKAEKINLLNRNFDEIVDIVDKNVENLSDDSIMFSQIKSELNKSMEKYYFLNNKIIGFKHKTSLLKMIYSILEYKKNSINIEEIILYIEKLSELKVTHKKVLNAISSAKDIWFFDNKKYIKEEFALKLIENNSSTNIIDEVNNKLYSINNRIVSSKALFDMMINENKINSKEVSHSLLAKYIILKLPHCNAGYRGQIVIDNISNEYTPVDVISRIMANNELFTPKSISHSMINYGFYFNIGSIGNLLKDMVEKNLIKKVSRGNYQIV
jgi:hypothetical protein